MQLGADVLFAGWLSHGLPEGMCSVRWGRDQAEYHGEFCEGEMTGYGRYIFGNGRSVR